MGAFDLIRELRGAGVVVRAEGGTLDISPADRLTDEMIEALKLNKPEILALLKKEDAQLVGNPEQLKQDKISNHPKKAGSWKPDRCDRCIHLSRFTGGNACRTDNGLPLLAGLLRDTQPDGGRTCTSWQADSWELARPTDWPH